MNLVRRGAVSICLIGAVVAVSIAQAPQSPELQDAVAGPRAAPAGGRGKAARAALSLTVTGGPQSPGFELQWKQGTKLSPPPATLQSYALVVRERGGLVSSGTVGTRHGSLFNIPATATTVPFDVYALDTTLNLPATATRDDLLRAMDGHVIAKAAPAGPRRTPAP
jgi:hypothetical protein